MHLRPDGVDCTDDLVARHARVLDVGEQPFLGHAIAVADAAGLDLDPDLTGAGFGDVALYQLERAFCIGNLSNAHLRHEDLLTLRATMPQRHAAHTKSAYPPRQTG